jgi:hypothetical protein
MNNLGKPNQDTISKTILATYWHAKVISENMIWLKKSGALHEIENNEVVGAIKDLAPKANYFINMIDKAFLDAKIKKMTLDEQQEFIYQIMELTEEKMEELVV